MLEAVTTDLVFTISLKRSTQNLQLSTSCRPITPVWSKIKTVGKTGVIPSRRGLAACRPLRFFGAINGALCGSADKWGETHGVGTYPGLHHRDGGPGTAAAERIS